MNLQNLQIYTDFCPRYFQTIKSDRSRKSNFAGFSETVLRKFFGANFTEKAIRKKRPISWEFSGQISLEIDQFCADLTSMFNVFNRDNHLLF